MRHCLRFFMMLACVHAALAAHSAGLANDFDIRYFTMSDGLNHIFVDDMLIDSNGFLWIATAGGGLSRYDSYEFTEFGSDIEGRSLSGNSVIKLAEDGHKRLWVAARDGLDIIDIDRMTVTFPADRTGQLADLMRKRTFYVSADALGRIWINNIDGLACVTPDRNTGEIVDISTVKGVYHEPNLITIKDVCGDGNPWVMTGGVVYRLVLSEGHTISMCPVSESLRFTDRNLSASDFMSKDSDIWIGTNYGLIRYDRTNDRVRHYHAGRGAVWPLSHDYVTSLAVTHDGRILVANTGGVDEFDAMTDGFKRYGGDGAGIRFVNCLLSDGKRMWAGTERDGLMLFRPQTPGFRTFVHNDGDSRSIAPSPVNAVYQDSKGEWCIGTSEYGLNRADSAFSSFEDYRPFNSRFGHPSVTSVCSDSDGLLWIGTWGHGVVAVDTGTDRIVRHLVTPAIHEQALKYVTMILYDHVNDLLWISTNQGLLVYDISDDRVEEPFPGAYSTAAWMLGGVIEADSLLWLAGKYGLYRIGLGSRDGNGHFRMRHFRDRLDSPDSGRQERLNAICLGSDGKLWIGSSGNGLYLREKVENGEDRFVRVPTVDGMAGNFIVSIHEDQRGGLWTVTSKAITCRKADGSYVSYSRNDLMPNAIFSENASCVGRGGNLVIGTTAGLLVMDPSVAGNMATEGSRVRITGIIVDGIPVGTGLDGGGVSLHESDRSLEISFSALDFDRLNTSGGRYLCRLKGFDNAWDTLAPGRHHVKYTNLPPGDYEFNVVYAPNGYAEEAAAVTSVPVSVTPYVYKRWWFILLASLLLLAIAVYVYKWRVNDLTRQKTVLQNTVRERTSEINKRKSELEERNRLLTDANREISDQKTELSNMVEQVKHLTAERINFFTSVTHEFRTPVTLIAGPIRKALRMTGDPNVIEQLSFAEQNSRYLLSLINQIMDFRKVESGNFSMSFSKGDFAAFIKGVVDSFVPTALELGIGLRLLVHMPDPEFIFSEDGLRKVMVNLLSNALKHTPGGGSITVYCAVLPGSADGGKSLYVSVSDTGCGLSEVDSSRLFDPFYQGSGVPLNSLSGSTGSGIGLHICRNIVMACGGVISARNNHGPGCSFRVLVPLADAVASLNMPGADSASVRQGGDGGADAAGDVARQETERKILTVMVVEDNVSMRRYIRSILGGRYAVVEASNGKEALEILANNQVDFIITDLMMPVMDGHELSRRLKNDISTSHIPVLVLTAKTSPQTRIESYRTGVDEYLSKPFDEDLLLARIENILDNKNRYQRQFAKDMDVSSLNVDDSSLDRGFLDRMMEVVEEGYRDVEFEVADFARKMGVGRNVLNQKMLSLVGQTAWQFVRTYRLKKARQLIVENSVTHALTISEIAYDTGFSDPKYFSKCFSKEFGISPRGLMNGGETNNKNFD